MLSLPRFFFPLIALCLTTLTLPACAGNAKKAAAQPPRYAQNAQAMRFADAVAQRQQLPADWVRDNLGQAVKLSTVQRLMRPAPSPRAKNWAAYRARFVEPTRIAAGVRFWQQHQTTLARAQARWGVPAAIIVGIIGVETLYGQHTGNFRVLDALATLAFDFPREHPKAAARSDYFQSELEQFFRIAYREGINPPDWLGSYAGASGLPQFMPSNIEKYAVDFDGDGHTNLLGSPADAIGSVANYLSAYGWKTGMPTHYPARFNPDTLDLPTLLAPDILPTFSANTLAAKGLVLDNTASAHNGPLALVELFNGDAPPSYVIGTENFYVITRYNHSSYYALAVIELGEAVARQVGDR